MRANKEIDAEIERLKSEGASPESSKPLGNFH
jgi:hypothetical protein